MQGTSFMAAASVLDCMKWQVAKGSHECPDQFFSIILLCKPTEWDPNFYTAETELGLSKQLNWSGPNTLHQLPEFPELNLLRK